MPAKDKKRIKPVIEEVVEQAPEVTSEEVLPQKDNPTPAPAELSKPEIISGPDAQKHASKVNLKLVIVITIISALVAAFVSGGVYVYLSGLEDMDKKPTSENEIVLAPDPSPVPTSSPAPTREEEVTLSEYSVQVLNGSGVSGAASKGQKILVAGGFSVDAIGNADSGKYTKTRIQAKKNVPAGVIEKIKDTLEAEKYVTEEGEPVSSASPYDIVVTIGAN